MEYTYWFAFVALLQKLSSVDAFSEGKCPDDFHFNYERESDNDSVIFEEEIWAPKCIRIPDFQEYTVNPPKLINASTLPDCFNLTVDILTVQSLSSENRYKFEDVRSENPTAENLTTCFPVLKSLQNCSQMSWFLLHERYHLTEQLTLEDKMNGRSYSLGYYFITTARKLIRDYNLTESEIIGHDNETIAITCDEDIVPAEKPYCQSFQFLAEDFQLLPDNSIYFPNIDEKLWFPSYKNNTDDETIDLCYPLSNYMQNCVNLHTVDRTKMMDKVDHVLYRIYIPSLPYRRIYDLGNYYFDESGENVTICLDNSFLNRDRFWCFTGLFIVSATCIFLTILLQNCMGLQSAKQNAKPLFNCLISMMFRYIFFAIRNFSFQVEIIIYRYIIFAMCLYFGLASFFWLSVLSFDMWHNFSDLNDRIGRRSCFRCKHCSNNHKKSIMIVHHTYAWGIPLIFVGFALFLELQVEYQKEFGLYLDVYTRMWFTVIKGISTGLVFFHGPIGLIIVANIIFFLLTVVNLQDISKGTSAANKEINKQMLIVCIKLFVIMGLIWIFEVIGYLVPQNPVNDMAFFIFDLLNASTGILIFLLYACRRQTLQVLRRINNNKTTNDLELSKISSLSAENS